LLDKCSPEVINGLTELVLLLKEVLTNEMYGPLSVKNGFVRSKDDETSTVALTSDDQIVEFNISSEIIKAPNDIFSLLSMGNIQDQTMLLQYETYPYRDNRTLYHYNSKITIANTIKIKRQGPLEKQPKIVSFIDFSIFPPSWF